MVLTGNFSQRHCSTGDIMHQGCLDLIISMSFHKPYIHTYSFILLAKRGQEALLLLLWQLSVAASKGQRPAYKMMGYLHRIKKLLIFYAN